MNRLLGEYKMYEPLLEFEKEFSEPIGDKGLKWDSPLGNFCVRLLADTYDVHIRLFQVRYFDDLYT